MGAKPDLYFSRIEEVPIGRITALGVRGLLLDIDNTLAPFDEPRPPEKVLEWLTACREAGLSLLILSNGREERVRDYAGLLGVPYVALAAKPFTRGIRLARKTLRLTSRELMTVGDQIFTDVWAGKNGGTRTLLVEPVSLARDEKITRWKRPFERMLIRLWKIAPEGGEDIAHEA